jgi:hypothetical protein
VDEGKREKESAVARQFFLILYEMHTEHTGPAVPSIGDVHDVGAEILTFVMPLYLGEGGEDNSKAARYPNRCVYFERAYI